jgi:hypothetical protein
MDFNRRQCIVQMGPDIHDVESRERKNPSTMYKILPITLIGKSYESLLPKEGPDSEREKKRREGKSWGQRLTYKECTSAHVFFCKPV